MMSKEIWNVGGITQSGLFLTIKRIDDKIIHSDFAFEMYDSYPGTRWNGGRPTSTEPEHSFGDFVRQVELLNRHGIGFNFTFSNLLLEEEHLDDERGNHLLERFHNGQNGVIVGSEVLARYIRKTFPKHRLINTLTHYRRDLDYYKGALDVYDVFVLPPALNQQFGFIEELGPERVEILVNETCHRNCPFSKEHYTKISEYNLSLGKNPYLEAEVRHFCEKHHSERLWPMSAEELGRELIGTSIAPDEVDRLVELGVNRFKLSARTWIGGMHQDIFSAISAFIFSRMESSEIGDMTHFMTSIIGLNPRAFKALS
jgi:hypothetical protein